MPVLGYAAAEKPRRPSGIISLAANIFGGIIVIGYGVAATGLTIYLLYQSMWSGSVSWDMQMLLPLAIFGALGMGCLCVGTHLLLQVCKE